MALCCICTSPSVPPRSRTSGRRAVTSFFFLPVNPKSLFAACLLLISSLAYGQAIPQFSTVEPHQYDSVNLATLGIQLNVPVRSKAGHIPFSLSLTGTSQVVLYTKGGAAFLALPSL